jgi:predicted GTPase
MKHNFSLQDLVDEVEAPRVRKSGEWRIVVAGEFESGKSSAINAMLRLPILPCNPGMSARPKIKITDAPKPKIRTEDSMGRVLEPSSLNDVLEDEFLSDCHVQMPLGDLRGVEIVEIPFHHDGKISPHDREMMADADLIIWITIASQAWRLSEKALIEDLPYHTREKSILAISRADKLKAADDLDKIEIRLQSDASKFFSEIVFMQASTEKLNKAVTSTEAWEETGGAALASIAHELVVLPMKAAKRAAE